MTTTQAIRDLRQLKAKFRTARSRYKGSDCLKAEWESVLTRHIAKEGGLWLAMPSKPNEYQGGFVWLADGTGACAVPGKPELQYEYAAALIPAAEAIRDLLREGGDIVQRMPALESLLRTLACGPYETADLGRWWLALLFREVTPKVSYNEADGALIYGATLDKDLCMASEAACDKGIAILKSKKRAAPRRAKIKFVPAIIPPDEPRHVPEAKVPDVTPIGLFDIRDEVADLVRDQRVMERFREQLRVWSAGMEALKKKQQDFDAARDSLLAEREKQHPVRRKKSQISPTWLEDTAKQNKQGSKATVPPDWLQEPWHRDELPTLYVWVPPEFQRSRRPQWRWPLPIGTQTLTFVEEFVALAAIHDLLTEESENRIDPWPNDAARGPFNYFVLVDSLKEKPLNDDEQRRLQRALQHVKDDIAGRDSKQPTPNRDEVIQWMREAFQAVVDGSGKPTSGSDTPTNSRKSSKPRMPEAHCKACIKEFKEYRKSGEPRFMLDIVRDYVAQNKGVSETGLYRRLNDNSGHWKPKAG